METKMEADERIAVERELSNLMEVTLNLENELNMLLSRQSN
jgi:hypothetical protein